LTANHKLMVLGPGKRGNKYPLERHKAKERARTEENHIIMEGRLREKNHRKKKHEAGPGSFKGSEK